jgi:hypothetical protein
MAFANMLQHTVTIYGPPTQSTDSGGGVLITYPTIRQTSVPCLINSVSASEQERFAQQNIVVTHTIAMSYQGVQRGDKAVDAGDQAYHIQGINTQQGVGSIATFTYLYAQQIL